MCYTVNTKKPHSQCVFTDRPGSILNNIPGTMTLGKFGNYLGSAFWMGHRSSKPHGSTCNGLYELTIQWGIEKVKGVENMISN